MTHPVFMHDQVLAYIKSDALFLSIDGKLSYEVLAKEFEGYWREFIAREINEKLMPICVCERCGNIKEAAIIERVIRKIKGVYGD